MTNDCVKIEKWIGLKFFTSLFIAIGIGIYQPPAARKATNSDPLLITSSNPNTTHQSSPQSPVSEVNRNFSTAIGQSENSENAHQHLTDETAVNQRYKEFFFNLLLYITI